MTVPCIELMAGGRLGRTKMTASAYKSVRNDRYLPSEQWQPDYGCQARVPGRSGNYCGAPAEALAWFDRRPMPILLCAVHLDRWRQRYHRGRGYYLGHVGPEGGPVPLQVRGLARHA